MNRAWMKGAVLGVCSTISAVLTPACASTPDERLTTGPAADLSTLASSYVSLRADARDCAAPECGGYFVRDVNRDGAEVYVTAIAFAEAFPTAAVRAVRSAPAEELVLFGRLGTPGADGLQTFVAEEAFRGMPGVRPEGPVSFYRTKADPAPAAELLNTGERTPFATIDVTAARRPWVDAAWLVKRVGAHGAVVAGTVQAGGEDEGAKLMADQIFVSLPDEVGPCPRPREPNEAICGGATVPAFRHDDERCIVLSGCVTPEPCLMWLPWCGEGYTATKFPGAGGCTQTVCEPSFLFER